MIQREKRNYIVIIMMSCFMIFTIAFAFDGFEQALSYGEADGIIRSVNVRQVESGSYDDRSYYTESTVKYDYTIRGREYTMTTDLREDYTGREGERVTVIYDKSNPWKSNIGTRNKSMGSGIISILSTVGLFIYVVYDIVAWIRKRKEENAQIAWQSLSQNERLMLRNEKERNTKTNIILLIVTSLCTFLLLFFAIPLWAFVIARLIDVKLCYPDLT